MPNLSHITKCILCSENPYQLSAGGFDPINLANPQFPTRVQQFLLELYGHLQKMAEKEDKHFQKLRKNGFDKSSDAEKVQTVIQHGKHIAAVQSVTLATQWAQGFSVLSGFETTDPAIQDAKNGAGFLLHSMTARRIPDDTIKGGVARLGFAGEDADLIYRFVRELLDASNGVSSPTVTMDATGAVPLVTLG
jgi:hypothetical protein